MPVRTDERLIPKNFIIGILQEKTQISPAQARREYKKLLYDVNSDRPKSKRIRCMNYATMSRYFKRLEQEGIIIRISKAPVAYEHLKHFDQDGMSTAYQVIYCLS